LGRPTTATVLADQAVDQSRLADIGPADHRQVQRPLGPRHGRTGFVLASLTRLRLPQIRPDGLLQIGQTETMLGGQGNRLPQAQAVGLEQPRLALPAFAFVGHQHHRPPPFAQHLGEDLVHRRDSGPRVDQKEGDVGVLEGALGLCAHPGLETAAPGILESRRVDHPEAEIEKVPLPLAAVPGHARLVMHQGEALADQTVEQCGFADIRPAHDSDGL
jgi:hypothetical protein